MTRNEKRNRRLRDGGSWNNSQGRNASRRHFGLNVESSEEIVTRENAIREFKARGAICPACGKSIADMSEAIADKSTGAPMHFDCVLEKLKSQEKIASNEHIAYIGQGRFAVIRYENPHDTKKFTIAKTIDWEDKNKPASWRDEMADLYSKVK
ncbi:MAG: hypothetical protein K2N58_05485 [Treponemataceae bacterium]|nr:hypothetical protein [Treponemataceae bacterium]